MSSIPQFPPLGSVMPEIWMAVAASVILLLDLFIKRKEILAILTLAAVVVVVHSMVGSFGETFSGMFISDGYSMFFKLIFLTSLILSVLISVRYIDIAKVNFGEYYSLLLFSTLGMMLMASAGDLIVLYLGLELMALSTYILAGFIRYDRRSNEAALKYFLLGAFASAILLFGISIVYGLTSTTDIRAIAAHLSAKGANPQMMTALVLLAVAFAFKIAAAPFHMWAPDVYEGAPTSVTAFMSVGPKAAGFAALGRVFLVAFGSLHLEWVQILVPLSIITMAVGNVLAISQTNIKRMLAYSSIAHAGYALLGVIAGNSEGLASMMNYIFIYAFMNMGAFAVVILMRSEDFKGESIRDFQGLAKTHPLASALMLVFMFSLTGIPPTAGFVGKFYIFMAAIGAGYTWLVVLAVIFSAISAYFYLRIVIYMYMKEPEQEVTLSTSPAINIALALSIIMVLLLGVLPGRLIELARTAAGGGL